MCWIERTSKQDSRESQSMMEWCRSADLTGGTCSMCGDDNQESRERESEYRLMIDWLIDRLIDWLRIDCLIDWLRWLMLMTDWRMSVCECHVLDWAYKKLRFTREPIDDGMVPLSRLKESSLFNVWWWSSSTERERERVSIDWLIEMIDVDDWLENECLWVSCVGLSVQVIEIHERANRWWNGAAQLIAVEAPVQCVMVIIKNRERESIDWLIEMIDVDDWLENECLSVMCGLSVQLSKLHERANRWWNGAAQLIVVEEPVQCDRYHKVSREREREWESTDWLIDWDDAC